MTDISTKRYKEIRNFYLSLKPNQHTDVETDTALASFKLSMLNRYYIFKKTTKIDITEPARLVGINHKINLGKILNPYFNTNNMIIDPAKKSSQVNKIYHAIRKKYTSIKPSVYLIRHTISENNIGSEIYRKNKLHFIKMKGGSDNKTLLIYKSPEKYFYPIYYQNNKYPDIDDFLQNHITNDNSIGTYLLDSNKIIEDLDMLVALSNKLQNK